MGKLKQQMIIQEELNQAAESWEHTVMSEVRDFINAHGADTFKDALMSFNKDAYDKLFHPKKLLDTCFLTEKRV